MELTMTQQGTEEFIQQMNENNRRLGASLALSYKSLEDRRCPECGSPANSFDNGKSCGWNCASCKWGIATTSPNLGKQDQKTTETHARSDEKAN
jgi:ribosomal protein L37AE/L43A